MIPIGKGDKGYWIKPSGVSPMVSIIVAFYNPKEYFDELLGSLSRQSYKNLQIVLVDDGSDTIYNETAQKFVSENSNRLLITKENGGVASARQAGLEAATGELVIHADADDLLPENAIQLLVEKMLATDADIVVGGYVVKGKDRESYINVDPDESYWGFVEGLLSGKYHGSLWNKLIKKSLYGCEKFEVGLNYMEDKLILAKILKKGPCTISYLDEPVYVYRQHESSATLNISLDSIRSSVVVAGKLADMYSGILSDDIIGGVLKRQRAFEIYQSAKKGIYLHSSEDADLIKDASIALRYRVAIWLSSRRLGVLVKLAHKLRGCFR